MKNLRSVLGILIVVSMIYGDDVEVVDYEQLEVEEALDPVA